MRSCDLSGRRAVSAWAERPCTARVSARPARSLFWAQAHGGVRTERVQAGVVDAGVHPLVPLVDVAVNAAPRARPTQGRARVQTQRTAVCEPTPRSSPFKVDFPVRVLLHHPSRGQGCARAGASDEALPQRDAAPARPSESSTRMSVHGVLWVGAMQARLSPPHIRWCSCIGTAVILSVQ